MVACEAPYYGKGWTPVVPYVFWSNISPSLMCGFDIFVENLGYPLLRKLFKHWREIAPNFYGDYYPLTPHSTKQDAWMAWQFNRPEVGEGIVQAFCRHESIYLGLRLKLRDLQPDAEYEITRYGSGEKTIALGEELMTKGLKVYMDSSPEAAVVCYRRL